MTLCDLAAGVQSDPGAVLAATSEPADPGRVEQPVELLGLEADTAVGDRQFDALPVPGQPDLHELAAVRVPKADGVLDQVLQQQPKQHPVTDHGAVIDTDLGRGPGQLCVQARDDLCDERRQVDLLEDRIATPHREG